MSKYSELPVYKVTYDLMLETYSVTSQFNREYKYTIGEGLKLEVLDLFLLIYRANRELKKKKELERSLESLEKLRLLFRISKDLKVLSLKRFVLLNKKIEEISKQLYSWKKFSTLQE